MISKKIYDITHTLKNNFPVWPGDPPGVIQIDASLENGDEYNSSSIKSSLHWGTHIDAPAHLFHGKPTIDQLPLDLLLGLVKVIHFPNVMRITADLLQKINLQKYQRVLFKTRNSEFWNTRHPSFRTDFTALTEDAAIHLVKSDIKLVGIDYFSLDLFEATGLPVHKILYQRNIIGLEGLDLREISEGDYDMICLPIKIWRGDGAPARVLLLEQ